MVSHFFEGAKHLRPSRTLRAPSWDLRLVLRSLAVALLKQADLKFLAHKSAFLLSICSAKRVSELCAPSLSKECLSWKAENAGLFSPQSGQTVNEAIEINAFRPDPKHKGGIALHTLCPIRALKACVELTQLLRWEQTQLFVSY